MKLLHILILIFAGINFIQAEINTQLSDKEKIAFEACVNSLPSHLRSIYESKIDKIEFHDEFSSWGAFSLTLNEKTGEFENVYHFRRSLLTSSLSEVLQEKESSYFVPSDSVTIKVTSDYNLPAFGYVLAHEMAHVFQMYHKIQDAPQTNAYWVSFSEPSRQYDFSGRSQLAPYKRASIKLSSAPTIYDSLKSSPFVSLYASTSLLEDFAELVAWHYVRNHLNKNIRTEVVVEDEVNVAYDPASNPLVIQRLSDLDNTIRDLPPLNSMYDPFVEQKSFLKKQFEQSRFTPQPKK